MPKMADKFMPLMVECVHAIIGKNPSKSCQKWSMNIPAGPCHPFSVIFYCPQLMYTNRCCTLYLNFCSGGEEEEDDFSFLPPGEGPEIRHRVTRERAKQAILAAYEEINKEEEEPSCMDKLCGACARKKKKDEDEEKVGEAKVGEAKVDKTKLTPELQKASSQGFNMLKKVFFPSMPALLQDLWVYLELIISLFAFAFGFVDYSVGSGTQRTFNLLYLVLAIISTILALIDGFLYIFQVGYSAKFFRFLWKKIKARRQRQHPEAGTEQREEEEESKKICGCIPRLPEKWLTRFNQFFELGRNIVSELLLYPLLVCDLFDFVALGGAQPENSVDRVNFGLFCIGSFYLVLAVYIMRMVTIIGTVISLLRIPIQSTGGKKEYINLMVRFCIYAVCQIFVHLLAVLVVAAKIRHENPEPLENDDDPINVSPFLWVVMVLGWVIPLAGVFMFFIVNYYWTQQFTIGFWIDMISLLQGQSFAEAVFGGEGAEVTKEAAEHLVEEVEHELVSPEHEHETVLPEDEHKTVLPEDEHETVLPEDERKTTSPEDEPKTISPEAKQKTLDFVEKSGLKEVKRQLKIFKSPSFWVKFIHPAKLPLLCISGLIYNILLITFAVSIGMTYDSTNGTRLILNENEFLLGTFVGIEVFLVLANFHLMILINFALLVMFVIAVLAATYIVLSLPFILLYLPIMCIFGYYKFWRSFSKEMELFYESGTLETVDIEKKPLQPLKKKRTLPLENVVPLEKEEMKSFENVEMKPLIV